jgi:hydrogenase nickel incorporation protein HypA/HybF
LANLYEVCANVKDDKMHETDLAIEIVRLAREHMLLNGATKVTKVGLKVGELSCVSPDALAFVFNEATKDTELQEAKLEITFIPATARCPEHGVVTLQMGQGLVCPVCHNVIPDIVSGEELLLDTLEVM